MNLHLSLSRLLYSSITLFFIFIFTLFHTSFGVDYDECERRYSCGNISVGYPFWGNTRPEHCGHPGFNLTCEGEEHSFIEMEGLRFRVLEINDTLLTMRIARMDIWENLCSHDGFGITSLDYRFFDFVDHANQNLTLWYGCDGSPTPIPPIFNCSINGQVNSNNYYLSDNLLGKFGGFGECNKNSIKVPILNSSVDQLFSRGPSFLQQALNGGFDVTYSSIGIMCQYCTDDGRLCVYDSGFRCMSKPGLNLRRKLFIGFGAAFGGVFFTCMAFCFYLRQQKKKSAGSLLFSRNISSDPSSKIDMEKGDNSFGFGVQVFTYFELEEATNNFAADRELGDGGFGTVYYGELQDGRAVAVKRLYESNCRRVEQFMNEVKLLARLRHQNLVSLYGCTSRHSRELLLVYEYIPNGTLADHLHGECAKPRALPWPVRLKIAIETASALTYLHNSDIIHRDVKTNNILLDGNFCVKVADFGLSRLFPTNATHVSTAPQGTPGYVDPEYHQCYQLTDKSDVYSFGVVLIELISSKPAVDITRHRHEINLSTMAINKIQHQALHELVDPSLGYESDYKVRRMITDVAECAFRCLQHEKDMRPSMGEVLEALKRTQNQDYSRTKSEEMDIPPPDEAVLLKSRQLTLSPVSVTAEWISGSTTPNTSS